MNFFYQFYHCSSQFLQSCCDFINVDNILKLLVDCRKIISLAKGAFRLKNENVTCNVPSNKLLIKIAHPIRTELFFAVVKIKS